MRRIIVPGLAVALSACSGSIIQKHLDPFVGQPARAVFDRLGMPDSEDTIAHRHVYLWQWHRNTAQGDEFCTIRVFVDGRDVITTYDWKGNEPGCEIYAGKLSSGLF